MRSALLLLIAASAFAARDYESEINALIDDGKAEAAQPLLDEWKKSGGEKDPQYWVAISSVWHELARITAVDGDEMKAGTYQLGKKQKDGFTLTDPKTKKQVGSIRFSESFDGAKLQHGYDALVEAKKRFPERLDIAVGLAYLHRQGRDLPGELAALRAFVLQARALIKPAQWGPKPLTTTPDALGLSMLNRYSAEHFEAGEEEAAKSVAELTVELYPDKPHGYNLVSHYYADIGQRQTTKEWLEKALAHAPDDSLVLANLADTEEKLGHHKESQALYQKIVQLNNDAELVGAAKRALKKRK